MNSRTPMIGMLTLFFLLCSCGSSSFSGTPTRPQPVKKEEAQAEPQQPAQATSKFIKQQDDDPSEDGADKDVDDELVTDFPTDSLGKVPDYATNKGSFSAWTIPADPLVRQPYRIIIEIRLPSKTSTSAYGKSDLSGFISGTDSYQQRIGVGTDTFPPNYNPLFDPPPTREIFDLGDGRARLTVWVPGANYLVRDTISIRSSLLNEEQQLEIVF